jgi:hypothetical protein
MKPYVWIATILALAACTPPPTTTTTTTTTTTIAPVPVMPPPQPVPIGPAAPGNCGTPTAPQACPPMPRAPLQYYPANK